MLVVRIRGIIEALVVCVGSKGIRYYKITAIDEYSRKRVLKVVKDLEGQKKPNLPQSHFTHSNTLYFTSFFKLNT
ncbi:hypothetical protein [Streptobacillus moniliformis]|uniref:hypothetical protein n=1 Tax=Streptobacillus moniliformis TaxID=34105 RepID=UPI000316F6C0|nr:hypothetical protein [Streptobacillus moniliformis]